MKHFTTFFIKELRDAWRSLKFIWIPLVFVLLGISDPLTNYYMDDILGSVGNMPDGFEITVPEFSTIDILSASTGQFQTIGITVLVAIFAGAISRERQMGTATLLYVRPILYRSYFFSKWVMAVILAFVCVICGFGSSLYYTNLLFGDVSLTKFFAMVGTYMVWILFVVSVSLAMSAAFKTIIAAAISIVIIPVGLFIDSLMGEFWTMTPWKLGNYGVQIVSGDIKWTDYYGAISSTVVLSIVFILLGITMSKRNAFKTKI